MSVVPEPTLLGSGIYPDVPFEDYRRLPYPNASMIRHWETSPKHGKTYFDGELDDHDTPDRRKGRGAHCFILESEEEFASRFLVASTCCAIKGDGMPCEHAGKVIDENGNWFCGQHSRGAGFETPTDFVTEQEFEDIRCMRDALHAHPCIAALKRSTWAELTVIADINGVRFKTRMDRACLDSKQPLILDLKKFARYSLSERKANKVIADHNYHVQAALYQMALWELKQIDAAFMWVFAEDAKPYDVLPVQLSKADQLKGQQRVEAFIEHYKLCCESGDFPGVWELNKPAISSLPEWA